MAELVAGVFERGPVAEAVDDRAWLGAMLNAEAALAGALSDTGLVDDDAAARIEEACSAEVLVAQLRAHDPDLSVGDLIAGLGALAGESGNPVVSLVQMLRLAVAERGAPEAAGLVHLGATSQDIVDTSLMLLVRDALALIVADLEGAAEAAARIAREHRATVIAGRTLMQQAVPTTFGLKAAGWMTALDAARAPLAAYEPQAQLGGAAGTLAQYGDRAPDVVEAYATRLSLAAPVVPWHTDRTPIGSLAGALGVACGAISKAALDVVLLAQNEVAEVSEAVGGGSSAMPHKQNPIAAISARASARRAPGLVSTLLASMDHEHERAAGAWHTEWLALRDLLISTGSAASWLRASLEGLRVDADRMRATVLALDADADPGAAATLVDRALEARR
jgi:3-carboxy-cis,cis-muconate cycloisomerase